MPIFKSIEENNAKGKVKEIYDEIKTTRQIAEVPNFWKMLANDPNELDRTWNSLKEIMKKGALDPVTKEQKNRPIKPHESVWYKYEQIFTSNYNNLDENYKKELLNFKKMPISGNLESEYRRVWTKPITTYASNYNYFDISLAPLKEHIFNKVKSQLKVIESGFHKNALILQDYGPYTVDCIHAIDKGGIVNSTGNALMIPKNKNHKLWFKYCKKLIDNPSLVEDLGERLYETVYPQYTLETVTRTRAEWYRYLITK